MGGISANNLNNSVTPGGTDSIDAASADTPQPQPVSVTNWPASSDSGGMSQGPLSGPSSNPILNVMLKPMMDSTSMMVDAATQPLNRQPPPMPTSQPGTASSRRPFGDLGVHPFATLARPRIEESLQGSSAQSGMPSVTPRPILNGTAFLEGSDSRFNDIAEEDWNAFRNDKDFKRSPATFDRILTPWGGATGSSELSDYRRWKEGQSGITNNPVTDPQPMQRGGK